MTEATLAERILSITQEIGKIKATGRSPFGGTAKALSIGDVEDKVRPLLVKHGVVIRFKTRNLIRPSDGAREWVAEVTAVITDSKFVSDGQSFRGSMFWEDDWADSGGTPAAAYSFARKSYLKALFHIADTDEAPAPAAPRTATARAEANGGTPTPRLTTVSFESIGSACPECGDGDLGLKTLNDGRRFIGCSHYPQCKFTRQPEAQTA